MPIPWYHISPPWQGLSNRQRHSNIYFTHKPQTLFRKAKLNNLSFNALRNIYSSLTCTCSSRKMVFTPISVCKYTKYSISTKQNSQKISQMTQKTTNTPRLLCNFLLVETSPKDILPTFPFSVNPGRIISPHILIPSTITTKYDIHLSLWQVWLNRQLSIVAVRNCQSLANIST